MILYIIWLVTQAFSLVYSDWMLNVYISSGRDTGVDQTIEDEGIMEEVILTSDPPPA